MTREIDEQALASQALRELDEASHEQVDELERRVARQRLAAALFGEGSGATQIDRYALIEKAGSGGLGTVWRAHDPKLDRPVAIKLLRADRLRGPRARTQLISEAKLMAKLDHPNVVRVYDAGEAEGELFVTMQFVDGQTLRAWQTARRRSWRELLEVYLQAGEGLVAAHDAGLIHGDFKPDNVLIDGGGRALVTDFAVTRRVTEARLDATMDFSEQELMTTAATGSSISMFVGTPAYMAPEQFDLRSSDELSDQFAFCVALWEALIGQRPFRAPTLADLRAALDAGPSLPQDHPPVPPGLLSILRRGLSLDPTQRWPSMRELLAQLQRFASRRRRAALLGSAGALLVAGFSAALLVTSAGSRAPERSCPELGADRLAEVWTEGRGAGLAARLAATGRPWSASVSERAMAQLTDYTDRWVHHRARLCQAERERSMQDEAIHAGLSCLERNLGDFAALLEVLEGVDGRSVENVPLVLAELGAVGACGQDTSLPYTVLAPEPEDDATRDQVAKLRRDVEALTYALSMNEVATVEARLDALAARVEALDDEASRTKVLFTRASLARGAGRVAEAEALMLAAVVSARRVGDWYNEATGYISLSRLAAKRGQPEHGRHWLELARPLVEAGEDRGPAVAHAIFEGQLLGELGEERAGLARMREAVAITEAAPPSSLQRQRYDALLSLAIYEGKIGQTDAALATLARARRAGEDWVGPEHPLMSYVDDALCTTQLVARDFGAALEHCELSARRTAELHGPASIDSLQVDSKLVAAMAGLGRCEEARARASELVERARALPTPIPLLLGQLLAERGQICARSSPATTAIADLDEGLALIEADASPQARTMAATFRGQLAFVHLDAGRAREALDSFERGLELAPREGPRRAELRAGRALALAALGDDRAAEAVAEALAGLGEGLEQLRAELASAAPSGP